MSAEQKEIDLESELNFNRRIHLPKEATGPERLSQKRGVKYSPQNCSYCGGKGKSRNV